MEQLRSKRTALIPRKLWKTIMRTLMYVLVGFAIVAILTVAYREENLRRQATELARKRENEHKQVSQQWPICRVWGPPIPSRPARRPCSRYAGTALLARGLLSFRVRISRQGKGKADLNLDLVHVSDPVGWPE